MGNSAGGRSRLPAVALRGPGAWPRPGADVGRRRQGWDRGAGLSGPVRRHGGGCRERATGSRFEIQDRHAGLVGGSWSWRAPLSLNPVCSCFGSGCY